MKQPIQSPTPKPEAYLNHKIESLIPNKQLANNFIGRIRGSSNKSRLSYKVAKFEAAAYVIEHVDFNEKDPLSFLHQLKNIKSAYLDTSVSKLHKFSCGSAAKNLFISLEENNYFGVIPDEAWDFFCENFELNPDDKIHVLNQKLFLYAPNQTVYEETKVYLTTKNTLKNYLRPIVLAFSYIRDIDPDFSSKAIRQGLLNIKDSLMSDGPINTTKYHEFNNARALFKHLIKIQVIPDNCIIPKGFDKPANTNKIRNTNPTITTLAVHEINDQKIIPTPDFIKTYHENLRNNLNIVASHAKTLITKAYRNYYSPTEYGDLLSDYEKETYQIGMTRELAAALQTIIVMEIGVNPCSLYLACVNHEGPKSSSLTITPDGTASLKVVKWRARHIRRKSTDKASLVSPESLTNEKITASFCLQFALAMHERINTKYKTNKLWALIGKNGKFSDATIGGDSNFRYLYGEDFLNNSAPPVTLYRIRHSKAVDIYISTGGDTLKVANYLGNKVKTALNTYIPVFLQEAIYRNKIANFQNLYLLLATSDLDEKLEILNLSEEQYSKRVVEVVTNPDWGGDLFEALKSQFEIKDSSEEVFFICSEENFKYALKIVNDEKFPDEHLKDVCKKALQKAGSSPMPIQRMLFKAKKSFEVS